MRFHKTAENVDYSIFCLYLCAVLTGRLWDNYTPILWNCRLCLLALQQFNYVVDDAFFQQREGGEIRGGNVDVKLEVEHKGDFFDLTFWMEGKIITACDRCLDDLVLDVDTDYHVALKYAAETNADNDEVIEVAESERYYDLTDIIYDTIALTIPMKHVHADGECNEAMVAELQKHSRQAETEEVKENNDPRWDALRKLMDNNK